MAFENKEQEISNGLQQIAFDMLKTFNDTELKKDGPSDEVYWTDEELKVIAKQAKGWCDLVRNVDELNVEVVDELLLLALYDCVLLLDDSSSMRYQEQGKRIGEMQQVGEKIVTVNTIFERPKGVLVEFLNAKKSVHVKTAQEFRQHYQDISFHGWTKLGTVLREKIVVPLVHNVPSKKRKPLLISIITDGNPEGEAREKFKTELRSCKRYLENTARLGRKVVVFQISQVGNSKDAQDFLHELENDSELDGIIDCTSNQKLEAERADLARIPLMKDSRVIKMLAGALLVEYDEYHQESWSKVNI